MTKSESKLLLTIGGSIVGFVAYVMIMIVIINADRFNTIFTLPVFFAILLLLTYLVLRHLLPVSVLIMILTWRTVILGGFVGLILATLLLRDGRATHYITLIGSGLGFFLGLMIYVNKYLHRIGESPHPLTDGYYQSDQIHSVDWHAGVEMTDDYYRFLQFFPDGFWLQTNRVNSDFDYPSFVASLDLADLRQNYLKRFPPTGRDGGYLFEFGTYRKTNQGIVLTLYCLIAPMSFEYTVTIHDKGQLLIGWNHHFLFHPFKMVSI